MRSRKDKCAFQSVPIEEYEFYKSATRELEQENQQLKEELDKYKDIIDRFEHWLMLEVEIKCKNEYVVPFKIALEKIQELEKGEK